MNKKNLVIFSGAIMVSAFFLGSYIYKTHIRSSLSAMGKGTTEPFVREHSPTLGDQNAKVTLVEFMDPACETCAAFHPIVKQLMNQHPGKIKLVIRYAPFHHGADYGVKVLEAARHQGRYWELLGYLFQTQSYWTHHHRVIPDQIWKLLEKTDLDLERLKKDMEDPKIAAIIDQDLADATTLNVTKTPGFFVNGKPLEKFGRRQLEALIRQEIDDQY